MKWATKLWRGFLKHVGMSGHDGDLSFSKAVVVGVLALKPATLLGLGCIAAAFGSREFRAFLTKGLGGKKEGEDAAS